LLDLLPLLPQPVLYQLTVRTLLHAKIRSISRPVDARGISPLRFICPHLATAVAALLWELTNLGLPTWLLTAPRSLRHLANLCLPTSLLTAPRSLRHLANLHLPASALLTSHGSLRHLANLHLSAAALLTSHGSLRRLANLRLAATVPPPLLNSRCVAMAITAALLSLNHDRGTRR
jgi:hypothetical protein